MAGLVGVATTKELNKWIFVHFLVEEVNECVHKQLLGEIIEFGGGAGHFQYLYNIWLVDVETSRLLVPGKTHPQTSEQLVRSFGEQLVQKRPNNSFSRPRTTRLQTSEQLVCSSTNNSSTEHPNNSFDHLGNNSSRNVRTTRSIVHEQLVQKRPNNSFARPRTTCPQNIRTTRFLVLEQLVLRTSEQLVRSSTNNSSTERSNNSFSRPGTTRSRTIETSPLVPPPMKATTTFKLEIQLESIKMNNRSKDIQN
jgi:hypothetical protein